MSVLAELNKTSLDLRKNRDELAKSLSVVVSNANQIAKDRATDKGNYEVTDDDAIQAIRKAVKQTEDTIAILADNHAEDGDLYVRSARELTILKNLLPQSPDGQTISGFVQSYLKQTGTERNIKAMGSIMKALGEQYGAVLDRGMASQVVRIELVED
jgi:uncharacterized protein YqeY